MALATTLFVATDEDLARLFVAVRMPLDAPITKVGRNPHTGQIMGSRSWDPGTTDETPVVNLRAEITSLHTDDGSVVVKPVVRSTSDSARALEELVPRRLRSLPHAVVPGMTGIELEALAIVLLGDQRPPARIVETLDDDGFVDGLPTEALEGLCELNDVTLDQTVMLWNAELATTGRRCDAAALSALRTLAREATACKGNVFTHMPVR